MAKLSKLLMYCSGASSSDNSLGDSDMNMDSNAESRVTEISEGTRDILRFFSFVKPYFNPVSRCFTFIKSTILSANHLISMFILFANY